MLANTVLTAMPGQVSCRRVRYGRTRKREQHQNRRLTDRFYLCGDEVSDAGDGLGLIASVLCSARLTRHIPLCVS